MERWLTLGAEVESSGYDVPDWVKASAILKLFPKDLEAQVVARPELQTYTQRLSWVKVQLAHQRATSQAQAVAAGRADMALGELCGAADSKEPVLARVEALEQLRKKGRARARVRVAAAQPTSSREAKVGPRVVEPGPATSQTAAPTKRAGTAASRATNARCARRTQPTYSHSPGGRARAKVLVGTGR